MIGGFTALMWNGFREARRNRVTVVVGLFALVLMFSTSLVTEVTVITFDRVLTDVGLGSMAMILSFLAIFLSSGLLTQEIRQRTIFLLVSKPLSRTSFLLARLFGNVLTLVVLQVGMTAVLLVQLAVQRTPVTQPMVAALIGLVGELIVLTAVGFLFSTFMSQLVSSVCTVGVYFAGHLSGDIYRLASKSESVLMQWVGKAVYYVVPNLERVNFRPAATYVATVPWETLASGLGYILGYAIALCALASVIFERRDFK